MEINHYYSILAILIFTLISCNVEKATSQQKISIQVEKAISNLNIKGDTLNQNSIINGFKKALHLGFEESKYSKNTDSLMIDVFETKEKYVFIRFQADIDNTKVGLFRITKKGINPIFEETVGVGFSRSFAKDINGDNYIDVVTSYYSPSGCCMRDLVTVRLYNSQTNAFNEGIKFMNPTFDSKDKLVRGIKYGHSGTVPIYKFKWQGLKLDTLEYIYPDSNNSDQFLLSKGTSGKKRKINQLPKEYLEIDGIDWFLGI